MKTDDRAGARARSAILALVLGAMILALALPAIAATSDLAGEHSWLPWPDIWPADHPLSEVVERVLLADWRAQPDWKLPMLVNALAKEPEECKITAYCSGCHDAGHRTRWSSPVRRGICAADPKYWGPGSVVWVGPPINEVLIVEDTGGAIKGPHRFDVCMEGSHEMCAQIGVRTTTYVPLHRVPPTSRWGKKPAGWEPPVWARPPDDGEDAA